MVMTTNRKNGFFPDRSNVENCLRASPEPGPFIRCPASTPLQSQRPLRQKIPESLTFVSLDFSKVKSFPKGPTQKGPKGLRVYTNRHVMAENIARRKNFDYYYIDKAFQARLAAPSNSKWLKSLCSQPVTEIFGKYRRHGEMMDEPLQVPRSFSTPGERAIHDGWDSNSRSRRRENSAFSLSSRHENSTGTSNSPQLTIITRSCTNAAIASTPHTVNESRIDALPQPSSPRPEESLDAESEIQQTTPQVTPRATPVKREPISDIRLPTGYSPLIDESIYANFERKDVKLPDINVSKTTATKHRKVFFDGNQNPYSPDQRVKRYGSSIQGGSRSSSFRKHQTNNSLNEISENMYTNL